MTGATWPTNDDDPSPVLEKTKQPHQLSRSLSDSDDGESLEHSDEEPAMFVPLRMILVPSEQEMSRYPQNTPPSPRHYPDFRNSENGSNHSENSEKKQFKPNEDKPSSLVHQPDVIKRSNDPQWADQDFNQSLYLAQSLPSPPQSPQTRLQQRHRRRSAQEALWRDSEEEALGEKKNKELEAEKNFDSFEY